MAGHSSGISWKRGGRTKSETLVSYLIYPPDGRYLPTDESIKTIMKRYPTGLSFKECFRYTDGREILCVRTPTPSPLALRAAPNLVRQRDVFMRALARACPKERPKHLFERIKTIPPEDR